MLIYDLSYDELESYLVNNGFKKYRALQVYEFLYKHLVSSFSKMTNIGLDLVSFLNANFELNALELVQNLKSKDDTNKLLFKLKDGNLIETVIINHHYGKSLCVTTQVGCNMGCLFCASGQLKKVRDLTAGEIISQVIESIRILEERISYIVVMGIGEPFDNYDNLTKFLLTVNHPKGLAIGSRHITVSTCGIIPKITEFSDFPLQVNLAISLHAALDDKRSYLMPVNKRYNIKDLMESVKYYIIKTKRRVTIEYILLDKINDSAEDAIKLSDLLRGMNVYVNLIPYNEVKGVSLKRTDEKSRRLFYDTLKKNNINVTLRRETGFEIDAACGQLRSNNLS